MPRVNLRPLRHFWSIAKPYWWGNQKWQARGLLLAVGALLLVYTGLSVVLNNRRGALISALSARDEARFWQTVAVFVGILVVYAPLFAGYTYLRDRLGLQWRRWLTEWFVDRYFADRAYYHIAHQPDAAVDNPDQRLAEDVRSFTQESLTVLLVVISSTLEIVAFSGVLWGLSKWLVGFLVAYAIAGTLLTVGVFGRPLVRLNFEQLKTEANFRFSLVRVRENAEAIAFYRGEERESGEVKQQFWAAFENYKHLLSWQFGLDILKNSYEFIPFVLPALVVAPSIFAGDLEVGKVSEAQGAFIRVFFSLNLIVDRFQSLSAFGAGIDRLYTFAEALPATEPQTAATGADAAVLEERPEIQLVSSVGATLAVHDLSLQTPNTHRTLIEHLAFELLPAQSLLVMGPSGCGKSSLLRAIAGLWDTGSGSIERPELGEMLFLPQRPYMLTGTLRDQLLYPHGTAEDDRLEEILQQVNLPSLVAQFGGLDAQQDWADVLSLGEQQRLTFARLLVNPPRYALLDEATSALDSRNEAELYKRLQSLDTAVLSVGHRETLKAYHSAVLLLDEAAGWQLFNPAGAAGQGEAE